MTPNWKIARDAARSIPVAADMLTHGFLATGHTGSGADRALAQILEYAADQVRTVVALDPYGNLRRRLTPRVMEKINVVAMETLPYSPEHNPLSPDAPETVALLTRLLRWGRDADSRASTLLAAAVSDLRAANAGFKPAERYALRDLSHLEIRPETGQLSCRGQRLTPTNPDAGRRFAAWDDADCAAALDTVRDIGRNAAVGALVAEVRPRRSTLITTGIAGAEQPPREIIEPAMNNACRAALRQLNYLPVSGDAPALFVVSNYRLAAGIDWESVADPAQHPKLRVALSCLLPEAHVAARCRAQLISSTGKDQLDVLARAQPGLAEAADTLKALKARDIGARPAPPDLLYVADADRPRLQWHYALSA